MSLQRRALHFVFKVGNRRKTVDFFRDVLKMKFLRHEEFEEGCKASCNGPYDGKWSKSMVGYGAEDDHFVIELTYNYGIGSYAMGNDFQGITILSHEVFKSACDAGSKSADGVVTLTSPSGYKFHICDGDKQGDPVVKCALSVTNIQRSYDYWVGLLGMKCYERSDGRLLLAYSDYQAKLELIQLAEGESLDHARAFGRIAFSCDRTELPDIEKSVKESGNMILTPLVSLDTPGKATVDVVILADPDGHEICFVGDAAFRELSQVDAQADSLLDKAIAEDKSDEWYAKKGKTKESA